MSNSIFILTCGDKGSFKNGPAPESIRVPLDGHGTKTVKKKAEVFPGMLVADHKNKKKGDMHASIFGVVTEVTEKYVAIKAQDPTPAAEGEDPKPTEAVAVSFAGLTGDALVQTLKELGVDTRPLLRRCETLIINGLNPEPGITYAEALFGQYKSTLDAGLAVLKDVSPAGKVVLAVPEGANAVLEGASNSNVKAVYPNSVDELVAAAVTGTESMKGVNVVSLHTLFNLGKVVESGKPLMETVVSVQGENYLVKLGTPVGAMLKQVGLTPEDGDAVILGGPMRGRTISDLDLGLGKDIDAVVLVKNGSFPPVSDHACIGCGECVAHCPARIRPNMISRYAEFSMYDRCTGEYIDACFECGMCAFYCTARRPLLQLIRLAKHQIALEEAQVQACALQGEE